MNIRLNKYINKNIYVRVKNIDIEFKIEIGFQFENDNDGR